MLKIITIAAAAIIAAPAYAQSSGPGTAFYGPFSPGGYWSQAPRGTARASAARLAAIPAGESPANRGVQTLL
jgi:hypothetical protein